MSNMQAMNQALFGAKIPSLTFDVGDEHEFTIISGEMFHEREYTTDGTLGAYRYWSDSGKVSTVVTDRPKMTPVLTVQTELRNPEIKGDTGVRRLFLKGRSKDNPGASLDTFLAAVRESGSAEIEPGAYGALRCTHKDGEGRQAPKYFEAAYKSPEDNDHPTKNMIAVTAANKPADAPKRDPFKR